MGKGKKVASHHKKKARATFDHEIRKRGARKRSAGAFCLKARGELLLPRKEKRKAGRLVAFYGTRETERMVRFSVRRERKKKTRIQRKGGKPLLGEERRGPA